jgi:hypothetical protein
MEKCLQNSTTFGIGQNPYSGGHRIGYLTIYRFRSGWICQILDIPVLFLMSPIKIICYNLYDLAIGLSLLHIIIPHLGSSPNYEHLASTRNSLQGIEYK